MELNLLNARGKQFFAAQLRTAFADIAKMDDESVLQVLSAQYAQALGQCGGEVTSLEAVYSDNDQLYGGERVEVPEGESIYMASLVEALGVRWYSGNEFSTMEIRCKRRDIIMTLDIYPFKQAGETVKALLGTSTAPEALAVCSIIDELLEEETLEELDSGAMEECSKLDAEIEDFRGTGFSNTALAEYLERKGHEQQFKTTNCAYQTTIGAMSLFQLSAAFSMVGSYLEG